MGARFLGAHMPTAGGLGKAVAAGASIGCTAVQVFTSSPQQWKAKAVDEAMVAAFRDAVAQARMGPVVSHDSYLINLATPDEELRQKSIEALCGELERCAAYGIDRVVSHLGAHMGQGTETGLARTAESLREVLDRTPDGVMVLMETTAGQGTVLNSRFEELERLLELMAGHPRLGVCVDTCHLFAAGYDLRTPEAYAETMDALFAAVGAGRVKAVHANDSKFGLGLKKDRHAAIGEGEIGSEGFRCLVNDARLADVPILLETPEAETQHAANLARLKGYLAC